MDELSKAFQKMAEAVSEVTDAFFNMFKKLIVTTPHHPRVTHLALHGKKYRTRKKNISRLKKMTAKLLKGGGRNEAM